MVVPEFDTRRVQQLVDDPLADEVQELTIVLGEAVDVLGNFLCANLLKMSPKVVDGGEDLE